MGLHHIFIVKESTEARRDVRGDVRADVREDVRGEARGDMRGEDCEQELGYIRKILPNTFMVLPICRSASV